MKVKFKVGDKVVYSRGASAEKVGLSKTVEATIEKVSLDDYNGIPYSEPLYIIAWPPKGRATIRERDLTLTSPSDTDVIAPDAERGDGREEETG